MIISEARARKILNSRGQETIAISIETKKGKVQASAPSGKSKSKFEAAPFSTKGIDFSVSFVNMLLKVLVTKKVSFSCFEDLEKLENLIAQYDKSKNWSLIGGNALFALEAALLKALALDNEKELFSFLNPSPKFLPMPVGNVIGGGMHSEKEIRPDIQEFLLLPRTRHFYDAYFLNLQAYKEAKAAIAKADNTWRGELTDENALCPSFTTNQILTLLQDVKEKITTRFNLALNLGLDMAASTFWNTKHYHYINPEQKLKPAQQLDYVKELIQKYSLAYVEDPFYQEDFESFSKLLKKTKKTLIVGDDLTATHPKRLEAAIKKKAINAVIVKPNQNGSLLETKKFVDLAQKKGLITIISHRSGETLDSTIADLAVAWNIPMIKTGILGRERLAKLHRLLKIERELIKK